MSEKYSKIFNLENNLFTLNSPILIKAGVGLLDNTTGRLLLQLKFENIQEKIISAVFVCVKCFDITNESIEGVDEFQFLDLNAPRNRSFGDRLPIVLPLNITRSVDIIVKKIVFTDGNVWSNQRLEPGEQIAQLTNIDTIGVEMIDQLNRELGKQNIQMEPKILPLHLRKHWFCACGVLNRNDECECSSCHVSKDWIFKFSKIETLKPLLDNHNRLVSAEKVKLEKEIRVKRAKSKKRDFVAGVLCTVFISFTLALYFFVFPLIHYNKAIGMMGKGDYEDAILALEKLNGFMDSSDKITEAKNSIRSEQSESAILLMNQGKYEEALEIVAKLNGFGDSLKIKHEIENKIKNEKTKEKEYSETIEPYRNSISDSVMLEQNVFDFLLVEKLCKMTYGDYVEEFGEGEYFGLYEGAHTYKFNNNISVAFNHLEVDTVTSGYTYSFVKDDASVSWIALPIQRLFEGKNDISLEELYDLFEIISEVNFSEKNGSYFTQFKYNEYLFTFAFDTNEYETKADKARAEYFEAYVKW